MSDYLIHYGVLGMKWGIRRYQNEDGTLTAAGRKRYGVDDSGKMTLKGEKKYIKDIGIRAVRRHLDALVDDPALKKTIGSEAFKANKQGKAAIQKEMDKTLKEMEKAQLSGNTVKYEKANEKLKTLDKMDQELFEKRQGIYQDYRDKEAAKVNAVLSKYGPMSLTDIRIYANQMSSKGNKYITKKDRNPDYASKSFTYNNKKAEKVITNEPQDTLGKWGMRWNIERMKEQKQANGTKHS